MIGETANQFIKFDKAETMKCREGSCSHSNQEAKCKKLFWSEKALFKMMHGNFFYL